MSRPKNSPLGPHKAYDNPSIIDVFHGGAVAPPTILARYLLGQKMEDFHG